MYRCFWCHEYIGGTALVDLVFTEESFVVDDDLESRELRTVAWHKECYAAASSLTPLQFDAARHEQAEMFESPAAQLKHDG